MQVFKIYLGFFVLFFIEGLWAQNLKELGYRNYTVEQGLPSNETYQIIQDRKGFIWIATDHGVSRFNGYEFENFTSADGLPDNTIFSFHEDIKGRLWFCSFNGKLSYFFKGKITVFHDIPGGSHIIALYVDPTEKIYVTYQNTLNNIPHTQVYQLNESKTSTLKQLPLPNRLPHSKLDGNNKRSVVLENGTSISLTNPFLLSSTKINGENKTQYKFSYPPSSLFASEQQIIATTEEGFIYHFDASDFRLLNKEIYPQDRFSYYFEDRQGGTWICTLNNGIYYKPKSFVQLESYARLTKQQAWTHSARTKVYQFAVNKFNEVLVFDKYGVLDTYQGNSTIKCVKQYGTQLYFTDNSDIIRVDSTGKMHHVSFEKPAGVRWFDVSGDSLWTLLTDLTLNIFTRQKKDVYQKILTVKIPNEKRPRTFLKQGSLIWIGGMQGLSCYDTESQKFRQFDFTKHIQTAIEDLQEGPGHSVLIATKGSGIYIYKDNKLVQLKTQNGLINNMINNIACHEDGSIWISSHTGISVLRKTKSSNRKYDIQCFSTQDGIPSKQVNYLSIKGDSIYLATAKGMCQIHKNTRGNNEVPRIYFTEMKINDVIQKNLPDNLILKHSENNLNIHFIGLYYPDAEALTYEYTWTNRLTGEQQKYRTKTRMISLFSLSPGTYTLRIHAITSKGKHSKTSALIQIKVLQHPLLQWWVLTLTLIVLLVVFYIYFRKRIGRLRREIALQKELKSLENKALSAQMNPHFIFNALTAIQHFIVKEDKYAAYEYLAQFAKLIRAVLKNSESESVKLSEELELLKSYLSLEQIRFDKKFEVQIQIDENILTDQILLPGMLIQPHLENAIRHGLRHLTDRKGILKLDFKLHENQLTCVIEDNGIGRAASQKLNANQEHHSMALKINDRRLEILNAMHHQEINNSITDLYLDEKALGTRVILHIPIKKLHLNHD